MPTPYEEISKNRSNIEAIKTDANLSQDSLQLGGIDAGEYALKEYVKQVDKENSKRDQKYTDDKVKQMEENLKGYTDTVVNNQDFTNFAKKNDLEAVEDNMKKRCEENCLNTLNDAKSYSDKKDITVLEEARSYADDKDKIVLNLAMEHCAESCKTNSDETKKYVDEKYNELFQSVSNGKQIIAEAITDKGVETSANDTYVQMAHNIGEIKSGGEGIDTSDATATSDTILRNYTAYAKGKKIIGKYDPTFIPDAPTYGIDTSDATASSADIKEGKTAYVNGEKIIGTLHTYYVTLPGEPGQTIVGEKLPEIYDIAKEDYKTDGVGNLFSTFDNKELENSIESIIDQDIYVDSSGTSYIARIVKEKISDELYIYINPIISSRITGSPYIVVPTTSNPEDPQNPIQKKWRYSISELGLQGCTLKHIRIGGEGNVLLIIENHQYESLSDIKEYNALFAHAFTLDLANSIIGNAYAEQYAKLHDKYLIALAQLDSNYNTRISKSKLTNNFAISLKATREQRQFYSLELIYVSYSQYSGVSVYNNSFINPGHFLPQIEFEASDTILNCNTSETSGGGNGLYVFLRHSSKITNSYEIAATKEHGEKTHISDDGKYMYVTNDRSSSREKKYDTGLCKVNIDYDTYTVNYSIIQQNLLFDWKNANNPFLNINSQFGYASDLIKLSPNNKFLFWAIWDAGWQFYELEINIKEDSVEIVKGKMLSNAFGMKNTDVPQFIYSNDNYSRYYIFIDYGQSLIRRDINTTNIILAIDYKGQRFFSPRANNDVDVDINNII